MIYDIYREKRATPSILIVLVWCALFLRRGGKTATTTITSGITLSDYLNLLFNIMHDIITSFWQNVYMFLYVPMSRTRTRSIHANGCCVYAFVLARGKNFVPYRTVLGLFTRISLYGFKNKPHIRRYPTKCTHTFIISWADVCQCVCVCFSNMIRMYFMCTVHTINIRYYAEGHLCKRSDARHLVYRIG